MENANDDVLRPITYAELDQIMLLYRRNRPRADVAYLFVLQQRRLFETFADAARHPEVPDRIHFSIYTPRDGRLSENGTLLSFSAGSVSVVVILHLKLIIHHTKCFRRNFCSSHSH